MYINFVLVLVSASSLSLAAIAPEPAKVVREVDPSQTSGNMLSAMYRLASEFNLKGCIPQALPLITDLPKIPKELLSNDHMKQALSQTTLRLEDVCNFSITDSVGSIYTSYLPTWYSWYHEHSSTIAKIVSACPSAAQLVSTVEAYEKCKQVSETAPASATGSAGTGTASVTDTSGILSIQTDTSAVLSIQTDTVVDSTASGAASTGTGTSVPSESTAAPTSSSVSEAIAPQETGFMVAAAAAVGFLGAVVAL
ncbi:hypothetical protein F5B20DRAFT_468191 [Whalleya microplaca]|nr:hypothetical protein F5B20DRAFT_468191 [Whalleya microplaca]